MNRVVRIPPLPARPVRCREQPHLLIITNGRGIQAGAPSELANLHFASLARRSEIAA